MRITLEESAACIEPEVVIRCREADEPVRRILSAIRLASGKLIGRLDAENCVLNAEDVYYFEAVDGRVFLYTEKKVYETPLRLYEIEARFEDSDFFRASKSIVANLARIESVRAAFNGRFEARLQNGEWIIISRQYVPALKKKLGL
ncbi:MAG TPA: LytTR family DNA-binding domain-containing protein [Clostridia bacterium]|nr:LytTR family DNA-binding domain-containing protein [Clostridia bacterium]